MAILLDVDNVSKHYRTGFWSTKTQVLHDVSLQAHAGETFGLLGPNGAGKTTTMKIVAGLCAPSRGHVSLWGRNPRTAGVRARIGYLPEVPYIYGHLTAQEFLTYCGNLHGQSDLLTRGRTKPLIERVGLAGVGKKLIKTYSKGMLQRLAFAQALINDPEFLFLDEPMSGLDPLGRHEIKTLITELKAEGRAIFFNSHILADVEALCDRIAILVGGRVIAQGTLKDLLNVHIGAYTLVVRHLDKQGLANLKRMALSASADDQGLSYASFLEWDVAVKGAAVARQSGAEIIGIDRQRQNLESFFVKTVKAAQSAAAPKSETTR